jgi:hypothetical protein
VDDEVETSVVEHRRRAYRALGQLFGRFPPGDRGRRTVTGEIVDQDELGAARPDAAREALAFHAGPEHRHPLAV